jgi:hypothetical protein
MENRAPFPFAIILVHNYPAEDPTPPRFAPRPCHSETERLCDLDHLLASHRYRLAATTGRLMDGCARCDH